MSRHAVDHDAVQHETARHETVQKTSAPSDALAAAYADVRAQVVDRLRKMAINFVFHGWERRFSDPLCPHALAWLYLHKDERRKGMWRLSIAWQLWLDSAEVRVLPQLLFDLHQRFAPRAAGAGFDIREELSTSRDKDMPEPARTCYAGLGVVSLDTPPGRWAQAQRTAGSALDVDSRLWGVLADGTMLAVRQCGRTGFNRFTVESTQTMDHPARPALFDWARVDPQEFRSREDDSDIVRWAGELSDTLAQADNGRLDALRQDALRQQAQHARQGQPS